jgi:D-glycero-D-manno-heptose 1,7-bisphosphate phosphatase
MKAVFLDRDGVINRKAAEGDYVTRWHDFQVLPGVVEGIAQLNRAGFCVIVVTNQRCIAKGLMTTTELELMHQRMTEVLALGGATIDAIYYCPHETEPPCRCRKPAPGMLLDAGRDHRIDFSASWMIGDSDADIEAGKNAGCKTAKLSVGKEVGSAMKPVRSASICADIVAPSLLNAVDQILRREKSTGLLTETTLHRNLRNARA